MSKEYSMMFPNHERAELALIDEYSKLNHL